MRRRSLASVNIYMQMLTNFENISKITHPYSGKMPKTHLSDNSNVELSCIFCHIQFKKIAEWQAHLASYIHKAPFPMPTTRGLDEEDLNSLQCRSCGQEVVESSLVDHHCYKAVVTRCNELVALYNSIYSPLSCILCKNVKVFKSQALLQIHLVSVHSLTRPSRQCAMCPGVFRSSDIRVIESHAADVHGPELNLLYWRFNNAVDSINTSSSAPGAASASSSALSPTSHFQCALSFYRTDGTQLALCQEVIADLFQLTMHTLCYHGYHENRVNKSTAVKAALQIYQNPGRLPSTSAIPKTINVKESMCCKYCGLPVLSSQQLHDHMNATHMNSLLIRRDYVVRQDLLTNRVDIKVTCLLCMLVYENKSELQIHMFVNHATKVPGQCGLCDRVLIKTKANIEPTDDPNELKPNRMLWNLVKYHERVHCKQLKDYLCSRKFNESLLPPVKLYSSLKEFSAELEARRNVKPGPLFSTEQYEYLRSIRDQNYISQVLMEIGDT